MESTNAIENTQTEKYVPPKSVDDDINLRRQRNITKDNYRPHIKYGQDFKHYIDNILNNKTYEITGNIPYYNRQIRIFKDQCKGQRLQLLVPRVMETIMFNYKDKLLEWEVPDARKKENKISRKGINKMVKKDPNTLTDRDTNFKIYIDNILNGTNIPFIENSKAGKLSDFKVQVKAFQKEMKTGKPTTIWISTFGRKYMKENWDKLKYINLPYGNKPITSIINTQNKQISALEKFKAYMLSIIDNHEIELPKEDLSIKTRVKQFCRRLHDKNYTINTFIPDDQLELLNSYKDKLMEVNWKVINTSRGGNTDLTRTEELNKQRSEKMKKIWEERRKSGYKKPKTSKKLHMPMSKEELKQFRINNCINAMQTPEARAKRSAAVKAYWERKKAAKQATTPVTYTMEQLIIDTQRLAENCGFNIERAILSEHKSCLNYIVNLVKVLHAKDMQIKDLKLQIDKENVQLNAQQQITIAELKAEINRLQQSIMINKKAYVNDLHKKLKGNYLYLTNSMPSVDQLDDKYTELLKLIPNMPTEIKTDFDYFMQTIKNSGAKQFHIDF